nr:MAG TPA: hypothetical protein [Caudoviricetes sp.]
MVVCKYSFACIVAFIAMETRMQISLLKLSTC